MEPFKAGKTLTIHKSAAELYRFWHNFENLPQFTKHLQEIKVYDHNRSHWIADSPLGKSIEWDVEITEDLENQFIAWTSITGADVPNTGSVRFQPLSHDRGTEVKIVVEYQPPAGALGEVLTKFAEGIAQLFGESSQQQIGDDLRRFKMLMETGEIATTEGQSKGRS
jgi:uncharacterized membrane protein